MKLTQQSTEALLKVIRDFEDRCIGLATGKQVKYGDYEAARVAVLELPGLRESMTAWMIDCRYGSQFWQYIKKTSAAYAGRREHIWDSFKPLFAKVESGATELVGASLVPMMAVSSSAEVLASWRRVQARRFEDPAGAITAARALLESACYYLLAKMGEESNETDDLPSLYGRVARAMSLHPKDRSDEAIRQILQGCFSVVNGLSAFRNALGDAHGKKPAQANPSARHADLAVNVAGSISAFLLQTYEDRFGARS